MKNKFYKIFKELKEKRRNEELEELILSIAELSNDDFLDLYDIILIEYDWRTNSYVRSRSNAIDTTN